MQGSISGSGNTIRNIEGLSACGNGLQFDSTTSETISDSWLHNNIGSSGLVNGANLVGTTSVIERNTIEFAGMRASDNTVMNSFAAGIMGNGVSAFSTDGNLIRNNAGDGIDATATSPYGGVSLANDYVCGNDLDGIHVTPSGSSWQATGTGLTPAYNGGYGLLIESSYTSGTLTFDDDSAFPHDSTVVNNSSTTLSATGNQWWNPTSQISGLVDYGSGQDPDGVDIALDSMQPTYPSNVMLKGQTIRVQGSGFNAIAGNPYSGDENVDCSTGTDDLSTSCCRMPDKANVCGSGTHNPVQGGGNCVELKAANQSWTALSVTSVTPTTIVTEVPSSVFACIGDASGSDSLVHVSKRRSDNSKSEDERPYCTNVSQL